MPSADEESCCPEGCIVKAGLSVDRQRLRRCAEASFRSLSAEIVDRLDASAEGESVNEHGVIVRVLRRPSK